MIHTIEIMPSVISSILAKYLYTDFTIYDKYGIVNKKQLQEYIRVILEANQEKEYYSGQAPGNE